MFAWIIGDIIKTDSVNQSVSMWKWYHCLHGLLLLLCEWPELRKQNASFFFHHFETGSLRVTMLCLWVQFPSLHSCCQQPPLLASFFQVPTLLPTAKPLGPKGYPSTFRSRTPVKPAAARGFPSSGLRALWGAGLWIQIQEKQADQGQETLRKAEVGGGGSNVQSLLWTNPHQATPPAHTHNFTYSSINF